MNKMIFILFGAFFNWQTKYLKDNKMCFWNVTKTGKNFNYVADMKVYSYDDRVISAENGSIYKFPECCFPSFFRCARRRDESVASFLSALESSSECSKRYR